MKVFVDTAPVMEKPLGEAAGIGWQGKHTNLVSPTHGSWLFLGAIYTTLELAPCDGSPRSLRKLPRLSGCLPHRRLPCALQIGCRGAAFPTSQSNTKARCPKISAPPWAIAFMAATIVWRFAPGTNSRTKPSRSANFSPAPNWSPRVWRNCWRWMMRASGALFSGSPIKRIGRDRFVRNCLYAAGNSDDAGLMPQVAALTADPDPVVADAAHWGLGAAWSPHLPSRAGGGLSDQILDRQPRYRPTAPDRSGPLRFRAACAPAHSPSW